MPLCFQVFLKVKVHCTVSPLRISCLSSRSSLFMCDPRPFFQAAYVQTSQHLKWSNAPTQLRILDRKTPRENEGKPQESKHEPTATFQGASQIQGLRMFCSFNFLFCWLTCLVCVFFRFNCLASHPLCFFVLAFLFCFFAFYSFPFVWYAIRHVHRRIFEESSTNICGNGFNIVYIHTNRHKWWTETGVPKKNM